LNKFIPTYASKALKGSSKIYISESLYIALAIEILAFWPPDKLRPFSPISVLSPFGRVNKSGSSWHIDIIFLYFSSFFGLKNKIFSSKVVFRIQGV